MTPPPPIDIARLVAEAEARERQAAEAAAYARGYADALRSLRDLATTPPPAEDDE